MSNKSFRVVFSKTLIVTASDIDAVNAAAKGFRDMVLPGLDLVVEETDEKGDGRHVVVDGKIARLALEVADLPTLKALKAEPGEVAKIKGESNSGYFYDPNIPIEIATMLSKRDDYRLSYLVQSLERGFWIDLAFMKKLQQEELAKHAQPQQPQPLPKKLMIPGAQRR